MSLTTSPFTVFVSIVTSVSVVAERITENIWSIIEYIILLFWPNFKITNVHYMLIKTVLSHILCLGFGIGISMATQTTPLINLGASLSPTEDRIVVGIIGGFLAPYSHQIMQVLLKVHKTTPSVSPSPV